MGHAIGLKKGLRVGYEWYGFLGRKTREIKRAAYTWTIDGQDFADWLRARRRDDDPVVLSEETIWLADDAEDAKNRISRLLGNTQPEFGTRTALLMCPECGGEGCGALSAEIVITSETVEWRSLGYDGSELGAPTSLFDPSIILVFRRDQYVNALREELRDAFLIG